MVIKIEKARRILLVEPSRSKEYHTAYPPLGLLKISTYHKRKGDKTKLVYGKDKTTGRLDKIYITSLFTYACRPVHELIEYYLENYKNSKIVVGGIYASLCSDNLKMMFGNNIRIHTGLYKKVDNLIADYSLVPNWDKSLIFSTRGCIRKCEFCSVCALEPEFNSRKSISRYIINGHREIILWDNNILASPYWKNIFEELRQSKLAVDFNQGLDARLITHDVLAGLRDLRCRHLRLAYDSLGMKEPLNKAIRLLIKAGFKKYRIIVYVLYNYKKDDPENFLYRIKDLMKWGVVAYPMRYQSLAPQPKNTYISPHWSARQLEMLAKARRVIGFGGAFPAYEGLRKKIIRAKSFEEAFSLRPKKLDK